MSLINRILVDEPSVIAINAPDGRLEAIGKTAAEMCERGIEQGVVCKLLKDGPICDLATTESMLGYMVQTVRKRKTMLLPARTIIAVPSDITYVERR